MKTTMMMIGMTKRRNEEGRARLGTVLVSMLFHRDGVPPLQEPFKDIACKKVKGRELQMA